VISEGWQAVKTKGTTDLERTLASLTELVRLAGEAPLKLRVDFNSCLEARQFTSFMRAMPANVRDRLEFVEDPFPFDAAAWCATQRELGVRLACDKGLGASVHKETAHSCAVQRPGQECPGSLAHDCGYDFAVLKPGRRDWRETVSAMSAPARIVMTSAMDHAIGQCFAAWEAAMAWRELGDRMDLCGLCTEHLFERDEFFERIQSHGGVLEPDRGGTGLGFDDVIARLPWKKL
jgi:O-succinylbenzoate synthase